MEPLAWFAAGLLLLIVAAELIVRHGSSLALAFGVKPLILGLTLVAVGTSTPELAISITAGASGNGALAVGNIAGTNLVNILLILGLSALLRPLPLHERTLRMDVPMMAMAALVMAALAWDGLLSRSDGAFMLAIATVYTVFLVRSGKTESSSVKAEYREMFGAEGARTPATDESRMGLNAMYLTAGIGLSVLGAQWLVDAAVDLARMFGLGEAVIGLTIVAIGTSAPELVTTIVGTLRNDRDVAVGNLLGSSIYNILVILGIPSLLAPGGGLPVEREILLFDIPLMTAVALLCIPVFMSGRSVTRAEGGAFVAGYCVYLGYLLLVR